MFTHLAYDALSVSNSFLTLEATALTLSCWTVLGVGSPRRLVSHAPFSCTLHSAVMIYIIYFLPNQRFDKKIFQIRRQSRTNRNLERLLGYRWSCHPASPPRLLSDSLSTTLPPLPSFSLPIPRAFFTCTLSSSFFL